MSRTNPPPNQLNETDVEWAERVHKIVEGLAATAGCQAEACETEWLAMEYSLESLADICKSIVDDFKSRMKQ